MPGTHKQLQRIVREYQLAGKSWPADMNTVARWAIGSGRWATPPALRPQAVHARVVSCATGGILHGRQRPQSAGEASGVQEGRRWPTDGAVG